MTEQDMRDLVEILGALVGRREEGQWAVDRIMAQRLPAEKVQRKRAQETALFQEAWAAYPKRPGNSRGRAWRAWKARMGEQVAETAMLAGVGRYAEYCALVGIDPRYILMAATFFGPDRHFDNDYATSDPVELSADEFLRRHA